MRRQPGCFLVYLPLSKQWCFTRGAWQVALGEREFWDSEREALDHARAYGIELGDPVTGSMRGDMARIPAPRAAHLSGRK